MDDFYKHKGMIDGVFNKCKECSKKQSSDRYNKLCLDEDFMEKERKRGREKRSKYNYEPRVKKSQYFNLNRDLKIAKGYECHHWNYNESFLKDVIIASRRTHSRIHSYLKYNNDIKIFETLNGELLDSKEKHFEYILNIIEFIKKDKGIDLEKPYIYEKS